MTRETSELLHSPSNREGLRTLSRGFILFYFIFLDRLEKTTTRARSTVLVTSERFSQYTTMSRAPENEIERVSEGHG